MGHDMPPLVFNLVITLQQGSKTEPLEAILMDYKYQLLSQLAMQKQSRIRW